MQGTFRLHWRWAALAAALVLVAIAGAYALIPRRYEAVVQIMVDPRELAAGSGPTADATNAALAALVESEIASPSFIAATADRFAPAGRPAIEDIRSGLSVVPTAHPGLILIRQRMVDRALAAPVVNDLAAHYVEWVHRRATPVARGTGVPGPLDEAGQPPPPPMEDAATVAMRERITLLEAQLAAAQAAKTAADAATRDAPAGEAPDSAERQALVAEQAELSTRYGPLHPEIVAVQQRIAALDARTASAAAAAREVSSTASRAAQAQIDLLEAALADARTLAVEKAVGEPGEAGQSQPSPADGGGEAAPLAPSQVSPQTARSASAANGAEPARSPPPVATGLTRIVAPAGTPASGDKPGPLPATLAALLLAALAGAVVAWIRERAEAGFRGPRDVEARLDLPLIAMVPQIPAPGGDADPSESVVTTPNSDFADSFRAIAAGLTIGGGAPRILAIASAVASEGKTTISLGLARSVALSGRSVLLIDCDGRRRALSEAFAGPVAAGLVQLLRGEATAAEVIEADPSSGAAVLRYSADATLLDLSTAPALGEVLERIAAGYDLVILDTPPILGLAESRVLAAAADAVLLVVRWRRTPTGAARIALRELRQSGANVLASVLTFVRFA